MTAQAITPLPPDATPPPARAQDPASGHQFLALLAPTRGAGNDAAKSAAAAPDASSGTSSTGGAPVKKTPTDAAGNAGNGNDPPPSTGSRKTSDDNAANAAVAVPLPLPIPLPAPPSSVAAATPSASAPAAPASPPPSPSAAINTTNLAALLSGNAANPPGTVAPTPPAASAIASALARTATAAVKAAATSAAAPIVNSGSGNGAQSKSSADAAPKSAASAPAPQAAPASASTVALPSIAAQLGARMAAAAPTLASQPGAALASLAHEAQKAAQEKTPTLDGSSAPGGHAVTALDALSAAAKPATASPGDKFLASLAKNDDAAPTHGDDTAAATAQATDPANAANANPPPAAPMSIATASNSPALSPELPLATPLLLPHAVAEQVALNLRQAAKDGSDHIQIQLQPADLGTIDVKLNVSHEGRVMVVVSADRSDTLNLLQQDASNLAQALRDAGLQADNSSLSFNLRGGYQFNQQQTMSGGASYAGAADSGPDEAEAILPLASARRAHSGSLDIHV